MPLRRAQRAAGLARSVSSAAYAVLIRSLFTAAVSSSTVAKATTISITFSAALRSSSTRGAGSASRRGLRFDDGANLFDRRLELGPEQRQLLDGADAAADLHLVKNAGQKPLTRSACAGNMVPVIVNEQSSLSSPWQQKGDREMHRHPTSLIFILLAIFAVSMSTAVEAADSCLALLSKDLKNINIKFDTNNIASATSDWFCSSDFEKRYNSGSGEVTIAIPIEGVPVSFGAGASFASAWQKRTDVCHAGSSKFSQSDIHYIYQEVVDPHAWSAFTTCEKTAASLVTLELTSRGQNLILTADLRAVGNVTSAKINDFQETGAQCEQKNIARGKVIIPGGISDTCTRQSDGPIAIVINTALGAVSVDAPPKKRFDQQAGTGQLQYTVDHVDASQLDPTEPVKEYGEDTWDVDSDHPHTGTLQISVDPNLFRLGEFSYSCREIVGNGCPFHYFSNFRYSDHDASVDYTQDGNRAHPFLRANKYDKKIMSDSAARTRTRPFFRKDVCGPCTQTSVVGRIYWYTRYGRLRV